MMRMILESFGDADPEMVYDLEQRNGLALPEDYKQFLLQHNGERLVRTACFIKQVNQSVLVEILLGVNQSRDFDVGGWLDEYRAEMPSGFLIVGLGATGMFILGTRAACSGVYFWDHAHMFRGSCEEEGNTYRVAATFTEFLDMLKPIE